MKKVSIIIPVYNVEPYVARCIDSVVNQTYNNLQIIVVNDGSIDNSLQILNTYNDDRLQIITKENGGLSSARNEGLKYVVGDYILFIDSDDWIHLNMINVMIKEAIKTDADIVSIYEKRVMSDDVIEEDMQIANVSSYQGKDCLSQLLLNRIPNYVWGKLYRSELFTKSKVTFPVGQNYEDVATSYKLFSYCNKLSVIHKHYYYYFIRENSIVHTKRLEEVRSIVEHIVNMSKYEIVNPYWGIYRLKLLYGAYVYAYCLSKEVKQSAEFGEEVNKMDMLCNSIKTEYPIFVYMFTPNFYKVLIVKLKLIKLFGSIKQYMKR